MEYERQFVAAGASLATGVDPTGNGAALPGSGDPRNLELLVEAEFTPVGAVKPMTLNGAIVLGVDDEFGSVELGKLADLIVAQWNPAATPGDIRNVEIDFKDGVGSDPDRLIEHQLEVQTASG